MCEDQLTLKLNADSQDYIDDETAKRLGGKLSLLETLCAARIVPLAQLIAMRMSEPDMIIIHGKRLSPLHLAQLQDDAHC